VSCAPDRVDDVLAVARGHGVPAATIGRVGEAGGRFIVRTGDRPGIEAPVADLARIYYTAIPRLMEDAAATAEVEVEHAVPG
jgi:hypothetical protein